jgi:hypothetical protein
MILYYYNTIKGKGQFFSARMAGSSIRVKTVVKPIPMRAETPSILNPGVDAKKRLAKTTNVVSEVVKMGKAVDLTVASSFRSSR